MILNYIGSKDDTQCFRFVFSLHVEFIQSKCYWTSRFVTPSMFTCTTCLVNIDFFLLNFSHRVTRIDYALSCDLLILYSRVSRLTRESIALRLSFGLKRLRTRVFSRTLPLSVIRNRLFLFYICFTFFGNWFISTELLW